MLRVGFVTLVATLLIGSLLYYTLHRSDMAESRHGGQQASQAAQQRAVAVSRVFASLSSAVLQVDAAKMQEFLGGPWGAEGLADAMLIDTGDRVLAATNPAYVSQQMQDAGWASIRAQSREWVFLDEPTPGQERVTVFEPVMDKGSTIAWARLSFLRARGDAAGRTAEERLRLVAGALVPVGMILAGLVALVMRLATSLLRQRIKSVVVEAMADPQSVLSGRGTTEGESARVGAGSHRAA